MTKTQVTPRMVLDAIVTEGGQVQNGFPYAKFPGQARWVEGAVCKLVKLGMIERIRVEGGYALRAM